jgi:murein DD-endopeptidase MepM/ murein hydrolase activator NlpD
MSRKAAKRYLYMIFVGEDGKISYTALAAFHGVLLFWTIYVQVYIWQWEYSQGLLTFSLEVLLLLFGARTLQRATVLGAGAIRRNKDVLGRAADAAAEQVPQVTAVKSQQPSNIHQPPQVEVMPATASSSTFITPAQGRMSSPFGMRNGRMHNGVDIAAQGNVPIYAAADGVVMRSYFHVRGGESIILEHHLPTGYYVTLYAHLRENSRVVHNGEKVMQGQLIGYMGNTGVSTGQHLHFEIHRGGWNAQRSNAVDPLTYIQL